MKLLYDFFLFLYPKIVWLISGKNKKANLWLQGRKSIFDKLFHAFHTNVSKVVWVHCASLGEFEQGRPVIEAIKKQNPSYKILLTFFSSSGYEVRKNYSGADWVFYLPMDGSSNAKKLLDIVNPSLIIFVKYEYWFYYLHEARQRNIPLLLVSGIFRENQPFFKWYGNLHKQMLHCFTHLFVQNEESSQLLTTIGFNKNVTICGDTRFDRVIEIAQNFTSNSLIEKFIGNSKVIVAGSTWTEDDEELDHFANTNSDIKFIIAPHDIDEDRLKECSTLYKNSILYSNLSNTDLLLPVHNVVIIDNIGMLSSLYKYATVTYVGGGFGEDGVHNVLEAAIYNKPVVFGPEYDKYFEAVELVDNEGAFSIENALELETVLNKLLAVDKLYDTYCTNAGNYVRSKAGATDKIINYIQQNRLLTN
jgi:3-deoxy-D-manno-octulosonic-acid transferase